jgi:hypothetical protein
MENIIDFPAAADRVSHRRRPYNKRGSMQTFVFRSYDLIVESDEADLVRDVCFDVDKAQTKLKAIRRRLKGVQEQAAVRVELLTAAETKLTAAIVAALLSTASERGVVVSLSSATSNATADKRP